jgi:hypothetical protein
MKERVCEIFDRLFSMPPIVDTNDRFDYENLELISGKTYQELVPLLLSAELDAFPLFSLVSQEAGQYYIGSILLYFSREVERINENGRRENDFLCSAPLPESWFSMLNFLERSDTRNWILRDESLRCLILDMLNEASSYRGFYWTDDTLAALLHLKGQFEFSEPPA